MIKLFDAESYLKANPDIADAIQKGTLKDLETHLEKNGKKDIREGQRRFHHLFEPFDEALYLERFPDVKKAVEKGVFPKAFQHFYANGYREIVQGLRVWGEVEYESEAEKIVEEIIPPEEKQAEIPKAIINGFDEEAYLRANPDVKILIEEGKLKDALEHLETIGRTEIREGIRKFHCDFEPFDETLYLERFPDVKEAIESGLFPKAFQHFYANGYREIVQGRRVWGEVGEKSVSADKDIASGTIVKPVPVLNTKDKILHVQLDDYETYAYDIIQKENICWDGYDQLNPHQKVSEDPRLDYVKNWKHYDIVVPDYFDTAFYLAANPDIQKSGVNPLVHYIVSGKSEGRQAFCDPKNETIIFDPQESSDCGAPRVQLDDYETYAYDIIQKENICWDGYDQLNPHQKVSEDPRLDYVKNWKHYDIVVPDYFDTSFYLAANPDIQEAGINPLVHYIVGGKSEGRVGFFDTNKIEQGKLQYDSQKETIVFVSHESSATGAPLLGYGIADKLSEKYNIVHIVLKKANIHEAFLNNCDLILHDVQQSAYLSSYYFLKQLLQKRSIKCVIINSVVGYQTMYAAYKLHVPIVFLIHEFAEYMRPFGTMIDAVLYSDFVITPAKIIQDSILKEFKRFDNHKEVPANMCIYPQGKLPYIPDTYGDDDGVEALYKKLKISNPDDVKIIVGSGWVQIRKGVDLFIAVARYIKKLYGGKCKFVWVGEGFDPDNDLAYSVYLDREIEFSGLGDDFVFLEHQKNLDNIFSIADVFCLASRMDPFPNVVIDALGHDLHVACFDHGSGSAEFLRKHHANSTIVDFVDTYEMASSISLYLEGGNNAKGVNQEILKEHLNFDKYVAYIDELTDKAVAFKAQSKMMTEKLLKSGQFDADYCGGKGDAQEKCRRYVEYGLKGIHFYNPKIGFSEIEWLEKHSKNNNSIVPLYEAIESKEIETHEVVTLPCDFKEKPNFNYAVHLHLYYIDMAPYFISYFKNLPHKYDLYITIVTKEAKEEVEKQFSDCGASMVKVVCVENIGRDLSPLLFGLKDEILNGQYDVIGHFHSKKSLDLESGGGDKWLEYLMQHLIGDKKNAQSVLSIFNDPSVGLVFPEDTNTSDIGENKEFVAHLCKMLDLPLKEQTPIFPMGNMFWARVEAIKELFELDTGVVLQPEPLPYDGSYMHALERITPTLSQKNGFKYVTVYKEGMAWK